MAIRFLGREGGEAGEGVAGARSTKPLSKSGDTAGDVMLRTVLIAGVMLVAPMAQAQTADSPEFTKAMAELTSISNEIQEVASNQSALNKSLAARNDEMASLLVRFPGIEIPKDPTTVQLHDALRAHLAAKLNRYRPIINETMAATKQAACDARKESDKARAAYEATDDYKRSSLSERLAWRQEYEKSAATSDGDVCSPYKPR